VDQTRVERMLGVTGARLRHARWRLLGDPELGAEGTDELGEHGVVAQVARDLWETGEKLVDGHRARRRARPSFQIARVTDLHAVDLQTRLYPRELTDRPDLNERRERGTRRKPMTASQHDKAARFRALHQAPGAFVIPNPWDAGSARILAGLGFQALATSSGAAAGVLGRRDGTVTREEALAHARAI